MAPAPRFFLSRRVGRPNEDLAQFELALGEVEINRLNLMAVSASCRRSASGCPGTRGSKCSRLAVAFLVFACNSTNEPHWLVVPSIGVVPRQVPRTTASFRSTARSGAWTARPGSMRKASQHPCWRQPWGNLSDVNVDWDEKEQNFKASRRIVKTTKVTQLSTGDKNV
ncbi:MAG: hypothetical protein JRN13_07290 [Nitrososphaerota archaeon]|nr:hypothetical protein [Nitrososphaerota archaeon]